MILERQNPKSRFSGRHSAFRDARPTRNDRPLKDAGCMEIVSNERTDPDEPGVRKRSGQSEEG
ncbi:hypothetical protein F9K78_13055 [Brucella pseudintermedia]|nr:hypothetical protein F9K78_13055 [Brucella pseudintermedia]